MGQTCRLGRAKDTARLAAAGVCAGIVEVILNNLGKGERGKNRKTGDGEIVSDGQTSSGNASAGKEAFEEGC